MAPRLAGERLLLDPAGALVWPARGLLAVADLHLEKGTACAAPAVWCRPGTRGRRSIGWPCCCAAGSRASWWRWATVSTIAADRRGCCPPTPRGSWHWHGAARFVWVFGNHDPCPPDGLAGDAAAEWRAGPLVFRHIAQQGAAAGEVSGHFHPRAAVATRAGGVSRPCFVADARRVVLPAFGAYAGGLDVTAPAIAALFPRGGRAFLLGRDRLFGFTLGQARALQILNQGVGTATASNLRC